VIVWQEFPEQPKVDALAQYAAEQMKAACETLTKELCGEYIRNHELSRGARVGEA